MTEQIEKPSGLKIRTLTEGDEKRPQTGDTVLIHYEIWMNCGSTVSNYDYEKKEYVDELHDSTYDENNPFSGPIEIVIGQETPKDETYLKGQSIKGLDEALMMMGVGAKVELFIPPHLGYGDEGASSFHTFHGYRTPPSQEIKCNVELVEIKKELEVKEPVKDSGPAYEAL
tara:strand:+ start:555 stop:1067 length:513 start_codon:yes stop_codon:yes gene_type:complete